MLGTLLVIIIMAGFALYQYTKGGIVSGFIFLMAALVGATAAFAYYELVAGYVKDYSLIGAKAYPLAFFLLFIFVFVIVKEVAQYLLKPNISFGQLIDRAGGTAVGALVGYLFAGAVLITIGLAPYSTNWLYGRFGDNLDNSPRPSTVLFNPDGFLSNLFSILSNGSLEGTNSFALVHADYVDQIFLNRYLVSRGISPVAGNGAVSIASKGVRLAPENLLEIGKETGQAPQPVEPQPGKTMVLVRLRINAARLGAIESGDKQELGLSQLRLVLKEKEKAGNLSTGSGEVAYPIGYLNSSGQLEPKPLSTALSGGELKADGLDIAFYIPEKSVPVLLEFRQNIVEKVGRVEAAEAPPVAQPARPETVPAQPSEANQPPAEQPPAEQPVQ